MSNINFFFKVGHRSRSQVKILCISGKPLSQGTYMSNIMVLSRTIQKLWPVLKLSNKPTSRSQVMVKVTGQNFLYEWEALVTRNLHAKYKGSTSNGSKVMTNVKIVQKFFKVGHRSRSQVKTFFMSGKPSSQGTYLPNIKALSQTVQKLWPMLKLSNQQQTNNRQGKNNMSPLSLPGT